MAISQKMLAFAERSSWIRKMFEEGARLKAVHGADQVCDFSLGNPDLPPPARFEAALRQVANHEEPGAHSYMPNGGYPFVRAAVARQVAEEQELALGENEILMTVGAAGGLNVALKALLDPGDEVIILAPFFVEYHFYVDNHGGVARVVNTREDFSLDVAAVAAAITPRTKAIIINSPNNPTGQIYSADELAQLAAVLEQAGQTIVTDRRDHPEVSDHGVPQVAASGTAMRAPAREPARSPQDAVPRDRLQTIYLIADEPYRKLVYDNHQVPAIFKAYRHSLVVSSYSKDLSLPGERIGYLAIHPEIAGKEQLLGALTLANRILGFVNAPALMQRVVAELQGVTVDTGIYSRRRELFCRVLRQAGYDFVPPKGAFYLFPKSPIADDVRFVGLLADRRILAVPGRGFGMPGYFRLAFCVEDQVINRAAAGFADARAAALAATG